MGTYLPKIMNEVFEDFKNFFFAYFENFQVDLSGFVFLLLALFIIVIIEKNKKWAKKTSISSFKRIERIKAMTLKPGM